MKKNIFLLIFLLLPFSIKAQEINELEEIVSTTKYYKTVYLNSNLETASINSKNMEYTVEVSEEEFNNAPSVSLNSATVETAYKSMTSTIYKNGNYYRYQNVLYWKNIPKTRSYDAMGIGFYKSLRPNSNPEFLQYYCYSSGKCYLSSEINSSQSFSSGVGVSFKLPTGTLTALKQTLFVDMKKNTDNTIVNQRAVADYAHAQKSVSSSDAKRFTMSAAGLSFATNSIESKYDKMSLATDEWNGTW